MLGHIENGRKPSADQTLSVLDRFLKDRLRGVRAELLVLLDPEYSQAYSFAGVEPPPELCVKLALNDTRMLIQPFLDAAEGDVKLHLEAFFGAMRTLGFCDGDSVEIGRLMSELYQVSHLRWLSRSLVHTIARAVEE